MHLRWGFRTEARDIAADVRLELGVRLTDRFDPWQLAKHLDIPVVTLSSFQSEIPDVCGHFLTVEQEAFSAVTVFNGAQRLIVHNDAHSRSRQASDVCHELSHGLLMHTPTPAIDDRGCRYWNRAIEDEATWLAGALLVTDAIALKIVRDHLDLEVAVDRYGVSRRMLEFRINVSGARARVRRANNRRLRDE